MRRRQQQQALLREWMRVARLTTRQQLRAGGAARAASCSVSACNIGELARASPLPGMSMLSGWGGTQCFVLNINGQSKMNVVHLVRGLEEAPTTLERKAVLRQFLVKARHCEFWGGVGGNCPPLKSFTTVVLGFTLARSALYRCSELRLSRLNLLIGYALTAGEVA